MLMPLVLIASAASAYGQTTDEVAARRPCDAVKIGLEQATDKGPPQSDRLLFGVIVVTVSAPFCEGWTAVTVFRDQDLHWTLRSESSATDPTEQWAYSATCPAMLDWLERLKKMPIRFGIGPVRPAERSQIAPPLPVPMAHGFEYSVRGYGLVTQPSGVGATLSLTSNAGEVVEWASGFFRAIQPCWKAG